MSEKQPPTPGDPLPKRFQEVQEARRRLQEGVVLVPENPTSHYDVASAARSIVIDYILEKVMEQMEVPNLVCGESDFCNCFARQYTDITVEMEKLLWAQLSEKIFAELKEPAAERTPLEAATMTLANFPRFDQEVVSSMELFYEVALHAQTYERLLQKKYPDYTHERLYEKLRNSLPKLLRRLIALDSVLLDIHRTVAIESVADTGGNVKFSQNLKMFVLNENDELTLEQEYMKEVRQYAHENSIQADHMGRTENRGCPFMVSQIRDQFINFVIEQYILQHRKHFASAA